MSDTKTWYVAVPVKGTELLAYSEAVEQSAQDEQPAHSSQWPPVEASEGYIAYLNPDNMWHALPDTTKLTETQIQQMLLTKAQTALSAAVVELQAAYPVEERSSWPTQLADARELLGGGQASAMLTALAAAKGVTVQELAQKVVAKNEAYQSSYAQILAQYQTAKQAAQTASTAGLTYNDLCVAFG